MKKNVFNYEKTFMGVRERKPESYLVRFKDDYRLRSLTNTIPSGKMRMLDLGCGGGSLTESLPYYFPKAIIYGCDISATAISYAKKLGSGKIRYATIKAKKFPYRNNFFDVCICFDVLEHVPDVDFFLREVRRILKKNGDFFLILPCEGERLTYTWFFQKLNFGKNLTFRYFGHIHPEFTHKCIIEMLKKHSFVIKQKMYSEHILYQLFQLIIYFIPKILLGVVLGEKKAKHYSDSSVIRYSHNKQDPLLMLRKLWFLFMSLVRYPMYWETTVLKHLPLGAWKIHVLANKLESNGKYI